MLQFTKYLFFTLVLGMCSCASSKTYLSNDHKNWQEQVSPSLSGIKHSVYLIGDVGGAKEGESTIPLLQLKEYLATDERVDDNTDVVFLGDNIYPVGMPPIGNKDRPLAEHKLDVQLESVRAFEGNVTFVPGNHDWYTYGREGLARQEQYIESYLSQYNEEFTDYFRPSNGCGNIDVMTIADHISLISIDSHWFLTDKPKDYNYDDCDIKTRAQFVSAFRDTMAALSSEQVLLTMHHPMFTVGSHGGFYSAESYLMPFTALNKKLKIPFLGTGAIVNWVRPRMSEQDTKSAPYKDYYSTIIPPIEAHGNTIVAAGHEHTLQLHEQNNINYIVSGSGSKNGVVGSLDITKFATGEYGFALLDYYNNGSIWITFYATTGKSEDCEVVYREKLN